MANMHGAAKATCDRQGIASAVSILDGGGVIIFPTDTVYGIGCNPYNHGAVKRVYEIKSRDPEKPLPVLVDSVRTALDITAMGSAAIKIAKKFWPGPLTIILDVTDMALAESLQIRKGQGIALRVPAHACTLKILKSCRMIAGTSANISGTAPTGDPAACAETMSGYDMILDGGVISNPAESTIIDARKDSIAMIRAGRTNLQEILQAV